MERVPNQPVAQASSLTALKFDPFDGAAPGPVRPGGRRSEDEFVSGSDYDSGKFENVAAPEKRQLRRRLAQKMIPPFFSNLSAFTGFYPLEKSLDIREEYRDHN